MKWKSIDISSVVPSATKRSPWLYVTWLFLSESSEVSALNKIIQDIETQKNDYSSHINSVDKNRYHPSLICRMTSCNLGT